MRIAARERANGGSQKRADSGIWPDHQLPRGSEQGVSQHWQDARIQPNLRPETRKLCVGHAHRERDSGDGESRNQIVSKISPLVREELGQPWRDVCEMLSRGRG